MTKPFENIAGKEENTSNQHFFFLFHSVFYIYKRQSQAFVATITLPPANPFSKDMWNILSLWLCVCSLSLFKTLWEK